MANKIEKMNTKQQFETYINSLSSNLAKLITQAYTSTLIDGILRGIRIQEIDNEVKVDIIELSIDNVTDNSIHWIEAN
jgi:hypothetical protein